MTTTNNPHIHVDYFDAFHSSSALHGAIISVLSPNQNSFRSMSNVMTNVQ